MTDASGQKVWEIQARPFGDAPTITGSATLNLRFPGQYFDSETGNHYNYFRDYSPTIGRYLQSDPIGLAGGMNVYAYVGGNPTRYVDPEGLLYWNAGPPQTIPVQYETLIQIYCVEECVKEKYKFKDPRGMRCAGGQEKWKNGDPAQGMYHSMYSHHYKNAAVDISGKSHQNIPNDVVLSCAVRCGFRSGFYEDRASDPRYHHWHLQLDPGNGSPTIGVEYGGGTPIP